jgi:hypothetical protein
MDINKHIYQEFHFLSLMSNLFIKAINITLQTVNIACACVCKNAQTQHKGALLHSHLQRVGCVRATRRT